MTRDEAITKLFEIWINAERPMADGLPMLPIQELAYGLGLTKHNPVDYVDNFAEDRDGFVGTLTRAGVIMRADSPDGFLGWSITEAWAKVFIQVWLEIDR